MEGGAAGSGMCAGSDVDAVSSGGSRSGSAPARLLAWARAAKRMAERVMAKRVTSDRVAVMMMMMMAERMTPERMMAKGVAADEELNLFRVGRHCKRETAGW